ncbi:hypothetical protein AVEN_202092-1 [Araneus ventricosus]|uniref:Uncharacterized protein n=1 Tax=Araneus ventricosus TaxID=182803 RepID=A0A4Y2QU59_ARAVE|nr:hypothetical protein AVEN_202092-1 [Araneus ventricosus]
MSSVQDLLEKCRNTTTVVYGNLGRWPDLVTHFQYDYPYTVYFEPSFGMHIPRRWGQTLVVFTSHLDLTWDEGVQFRLFHVGNVNGMAWDAYRADCPDTTAVDALHCTRLVDAYVTLLQFVDFWNREMRPEWRFVCPRAWKLKVMRALQNTQKVLKCIRFKSRNVDESLEKHYALDETLPVWNV